MDTQSFILSFVLLIAFIAMLVLLEWRRNRREKAKEQPVVTVDQLVAKYGDPDDIIVVNPTQGNLSDSVIIVYNDRKSLIINGEEIPMNQITDVSFNNYANAYLPSSYMIQIYTKLPDKDLLKVYSNNPSPVFAKEIVQQIRELLSQNLA